MKKAFTLAEILITLGIIGVVAALTMPALITKHKKHITVTRLKHTYSTLAQAVKMSEVVNGETAEWDFSTCVTEDICFQQYLMPYIKGIKRENMNTTWQRAKFLELSGANEQGLRVMRPDEGVAYTLANGVVIFVHKMTDIDSGLGLAVDIDGIKPVNQFGKDMFYFVVTKKYGVVPMGYADTSLEESYGDYDRTKIMNGVNSYRYGCKKTLRGMWCTALIMVDGWQIKDDYPW